MKLLLDVEGSIWCYAPITIAILAPLSWIRTLEKFRYGFIYAGFAILTMVIVLITFDSMIIFEHDNNAGPGWQAFNYEGCWTMASIATCMFEGIPTVLPILEASAARENFTTILIAALSTLCVICITFAELCYYTFGNDIKEPLIMW